METEGLYAIRVPNSIDFEPSKDALRLKRRLVAGCYPPGSKVVRLAYDLGARAKAFLAPLAAGRKARAQDGSKAA